MIAIDIIIALVTQSIIKGNRPRDKVFNIQDILLKVFPSVFFVIFLFFYIGKAVYNLCVRNALGNETSKEFAFD